MLLRNNIFNKLCDPFVTPVLILITKVTAKLWLPIPCSLTSTVDVDTLFPHFWDKRVLENNPPKTYFI